MLGEADYCMSPTGELSTFSKTAIARSYCKYIDFNEGHKCDASKATTETNFLLRTTTGDEHLQIDIPLATEQQIMDTIEIYEIKTSEPCLEGARDIEGYWHQQDLLH